MVTFCDACGPTRRGFARPCLAQAVAHDEQDALEREMQRVVQNPPAATIAALVELGLVKPRAKQPGRDAE